GGRPGDFGFGGAGGAGAAEEVPVSGGHDAGGAGERVGGDGEAGGRAGGGVHLAADGGGGQLHTDAAAAGGQAVFDADRGHFFEYGAGDGGDGAGGAGGRGGGWRGRERGDDGAGEGERGERGGDGDAGGQRGDGGGADHAGGDGEGAAVRDPGRGAHGGRRRRRRDRWLGHGHADGRPEDPDPPEGVRPPAPRPVGQGDRGDGAADRRPRGGSSPAPHRHQPLDRAPLAPRRQDLPRAVRDAHAQAITGHPRPHAPDRGRADEARSPVGGRRGNQALRGRRRWPARKD